MFKTNRLAGAFFEKRLPFFPLIFRPFVHRAVAVL